MYRSILQSAASAGNPVRLKMLDNTEVRGHIRFLDRDGFVVIEGRIVNLALVREVLVTEQAMDRICTESTPINELT